MSKACCTRATYFPAAGCQERMFSHERCFFYFSYGLSAACGGQEFTGEIDYDLLHSKLVCLKTCVRTYMYRGLLQAKT